MTTPTGRQARDRDADLLASDEALLAASTTDTYRASGPGGQHRNKTESAIRLTHRPTGVVVTATERRSQHENRRRAVERLRKAVALEVRCAVAVGEVPTAPVAAAVQGAAWPRLKVGSAAWLLAAAHVLDRLEAAGGGAAEAAAALGVSTASLVKFLSLDDDLWQAANHLRRRFNLKPLR